MSPFSAPDDRPSFDEWLNFVCPRGGQRKPFPARPVAEPGQAAMVVPAPIKFAPFHEGHN